MILHDPTVSIYGREREREDDGPRLSGAANRRPRGLGWTPAEGAWPGAPAEVHGVGWVGVNM